jgi:hypothetical protein
MLLAELGANRLAVDLIVANAELAAIGPSRVPGSAYRALLVGGGQQRLP